MPKVITDKIADTLKLDINDSNISDVIIRRKFSKIHYFFNAMTYKVSTDINKVIRNKKFIIFDDNGKNCFNGFCLIYNEEYDVLFLVKARFKKVGIKYKWVELSRGYIDKKNYRAHGTYYVWSEDMDICGQAVSTVQAEEGKLIKQDYSVVTNGFLFPFTNLNNIPCGAQKTLLKYLGGAIANNRYSDAITYHDAAEISTVLCSYAWSRSVNYDTMRIFYCDEVKFMFLPMSVTSACRLA